MSGGGGADCFTEEQTVVQAEQLIASYKFSEAYNIKHAQLYSDDIIRINRFLSFVALSLSIIYQLTQCVK